MLLRTLGIASLCVAILVLLAGAYVTMLGYLSFGQYAEHPPGVAAKVRDVYPLALWTIAITAVPVSLGIFLILRARRSEGGEDARAKRGVTAR